MKRGVMLLIIFSILVVLILILSSVAVYFYNFYVFETVHICVGEASNTKIPCGVTNDCLDIMETGGLMAKIGNVPNFTKEGLDRVISEAVYCDGTCFVKNIRGIDLETQQLEILDNCFENETDIVFEVRGKEGIEILKWLKEQKS